MNIPDFFIIGAPKCGTTALSEYLREHPQICFSHIKEPHFFSDDFPNFKVDRTLDNYMRLNFSHFRPQQHAIKGESSVYYYLSAVALPNILRANPTAKFIYMVRNPVDMIHSFHSQMCFSYEDNVLEFEAAWALQATRARGKCIPKICREPRLLQYREVGKLGSHLKSLCFIIPTNQLHVIVFDDLVNSAKVVFEQVLQFLGVPSDERQSFPVINENKVSRSKLLSRLSAIPRPLHNAVREFKHLFGISHVPLNILAKMNTQRAPRSRLSEAFRRQLVAEFESEVRLLEQCLNRDLCDWRV